MNRLKQLRTRRLYLRFFEVVPDADGRPVPQATLVFNQKPSVPVVPVIFLENAVFSRKPNPDDLAAKLWRRVQDMAEFNGLELSPELHLDCDWTTSTRESFFAFTAALRRQLSPNQELAVTPRLDQFKNHRVTGVPPADRGVLMAYNMGDIKALGPGNSIIDPVAAARYLPPGQTYPLPLDAALPLFSWAVVFDEHDRYLGLLTPPPEELNMPDHCQPLGGAMYSVVKPFDSPGGRRILPDWRLRLEESAPADLKAVAGLMSRTGVTFNRLIFYHLDEDLIQGWSREELEATAERLAPIKKLVD